MRISVLIIFDLLPCYKLQSQSRSDMNQINSPPSAGGCIVNTELALFLRRAG